MALTGTDRGTGANGTTGLTLAVVPGSNLAAGSTAVLVVAADNTGASGIYSITTATDTKGNTWTRRQSPLYDPGAAAAGVQGAIFTTPQNGGALTTGDTITVTFSVTTVAKAWTLMEVAPSGGFAVRYISGGVNAGAASAAPTVTTGSITSANMVIGGLFNEYGTAQVVTEDGDSTNGSWSTQQTNEVGTTAAGISVSSQRKVVTATATQTFNPTLGTSSDVILAWVELAQVEVPTCYSAAVRADSPVAYWRLGEPSGTNANDEIGTLDGTYMNTPTLAQTGALSGDSNTAALFTAASSEAVEVPDNAVLDLADVVTMEAWIKRSETGVADKGIVSKGVGAYYIRLGSDHKIHFLASNAADMVQSTSTITDTSTWHHIVATKTGATLGIYIDGDAVTGTVANTTLVNNILKFRIGADTNVADAGAEFFSGSIDEVAIYGTALTAARVLAHFEARTASCVPRFTPYPQLLAS